MTRGKFFKSKSDTLGKFQFKLWHVVNLLIQHLTRFDFFHDISQKNAQFFSEKMPLKKHQEGKICQFCGTKTIHVNFWMQLFLEFDVFWNFQLKIGHFLNSINQSLTLCKDFDSKFDRCWNFESKSDKL